PTGRICVRCKGYWPRFSGTSYPGKAATRIPDGGLRRLKRRGSNAMQRLAFAAGEMVSLPNVGAMRGAPRAAIPLWLTLLLLTILAGCESILPSVRPSEGHITAPQVR